MGGENEMKVLVLGAGAVGGYFGGRLVEKGVDVTFLVRERRRQQLAARGLKIHSVHGDYQFQPNLITAGEEKGPFDIIFLSTKAYHFADAVESIRDYVGKDTLVIPLLNGIQHIAHLQELFGAERVLGGLCFIETTLNEEGDVVQTSTTHDLLYGEWGGGRSNRIGAVEQLFSGANARFRLSEHIQREMWHKYLFITTFSGMTTLMNSPIGPIREAEAGLPLIRQLAEEVAEVMRVIGAPIADDIVEKQMETYAKQGYAMKSSMLRDMEKGLSVEADHLQGYLLKHAEQHKLSTPLLRIVYNNLKVYEIKRSAQL